MIDKFLEIGSSMDGLTPLAAFVQDLLQGSSFQINVPADCGYSAAQIENELRQKGVTVWGVMVVEQTITLSVRQTQAEYALYWLNRWGVPLEGHSTLEESKQASGAQQVPKRSHARRGALEQILDSINTFAENLNGR